MAALSGCKQAAAQSLRREKEGDSIGTLGFSFVCFMACHSRPTSVADLVALAILVAELIVLAPLVPKLVALALLVVELDATAPLVAELLAAAPQW